MTVQRLVRTKLSPVLSPVATRFNAEAQEVAPVMAYLTTPVAVVAYVLALWRLGADLNWAREFFVSEGLLSRWQVWLAIAIATQLLGNQFTRMSRPKGPALP